MISRTMRILFYLFVAFGLLCLNSVEVISQNYKGNDVHPHPSPDEHEVSKAFKSMSTYCFEKMECQKCAESFHDSLNNVEDTIFDKIASSRGVRETVQNSIQSMSETFSEKILSICETLLKKKAETGSPNGYVLFTNYSGTAKNQGVFLTTLYSVIPRTSGLKYKKTPNLNFLTALSRPNKDLNELVSPYSVDTEYKFNPNSPTEEFGVNYRSADIWSRDIPNKFEQFSKMGQDNANKQKTFALKYEEKYERLPQDSTNMNNSMNNPSKAVVGVPFLESTAALHQKRNITPFNMSSMPFIIPLRHIHQAPNFNLSFFPDLNKFRGGNAQKAKDSPGLKSINDTKLWISIPFDPQLSWHTQMPQLPVLAPRDKFPSTPSLQNGNVDYFLAMVPTGVYDEVSNIMTLTNFSSVEFPVSRNATSGTITLPETKEAMTTSPFRISSGIPLVTSSSSGGIDMEQLNKMIEGKDMNSSNPFEFLFNITNGNNSWLVPSMGQRNDSINIIQYPEKSFTDQYMSEKYDFAENESTATNRTFFKKMREVEPGLFHELLKTLSRTTQSVEQRLLDAANESVKDIKKAGRETFQIIQSSYDNDTSHQPFAGTVIELPNNNFAVAQTISFYVQTIGDKISYIEQLPVTSENGEVETIFQSIRKAVSGYWNKFASGSCASMIDFVSSTFDGMVDTFDFNQLLNPPKQVSVDKLMREELNSSEVGNIGIPFGESKNILSGEGLHVERKNNFVKGDYLINNFTQSNFKQFSGPEGKSAVLTQLPLPRQPNFSESSQERTKESLVGKQNQAETGYDSSNDEAIMTKNSALIRTCEMAKQNNLFSSTSNIPRVRELFFNTKSQHGVAVISFSYPKSFELLGISKAYNISGFGNNDLAVTDNTEISSSPEIQDIYRNFSEIVRDQMKRKTDQVVNAYELLVTSAKDKLGQFRERAQSALKDVMVKKDELVKELMGHTPKKLSSYQLDKEVEEFHGEVMKKLNKVKKCQQEDHNCIVDAVRTTSALWDKSISSMQRDGRYWVGYTVLMLNYFIHLWLQISLFDIPSTQKQIVTFFDTTPDGTKITQMINFEAIRHDDNDLLSRLEASLISETAVAFSPAALAIYVGVGVSIFLAYIWTKLAQPKQLLSQIDGSISTSAPLPEELINGNYYRMQDA